jgi:hypothetical protein
MRFRDVHDILQGWIIGLAAPVRRWALSAEEQEREQNNNGPPMDQKERYGTAHIDIITITCLPKF